MPRTLFSPYVIAGAFGVFAVFVGAKHAGAGEVGASDLVCQANEYPKERIPVDVGLLADQKKAYVADRKSRRLIYSPEVARRLPEGVVKLHFADACLEIIQNTNDACASVRYLRTLGAIDKSDVSEIETYYIELARRDPKQQDEAYKTIKQVFSCF